MFFVKREKRLLIDTVRETGRSSLLNLCFENHIRECKYIAFM